MGKVGTRIIVALVAGLGALAGVAPGAGASQWRVGNERRAALFGDSLAFEAAGDFVFSARLAGYGVETHVFGGTAPCDWLGDLAELAARPPAERPAVALIEFTGNAFTSCMRPGGATLSDDEIVAAYERDGATFVTGLLGAGIRPVFALAPAVDHVSLVPRINDTWRSLAATYPGVAVIDAGIPVEAPDGSFARTLPCAGWEGPAQGCANGEVVVRAPDGTHFCPTETLIIDGVVGMCPVASPGAVRYALGLAEGLNAAPVTPLPLRPLGVTSPGRTPGSAPGA